MCRTSPSAQTQEMKIALATCSLNLTTSTTKENTSRKVLFSTALPPFNKSRPLFPILFYPTYHPTVTPHYPNLVLLHGSDPIPFTSTFTRTNTSTNCQSPPIKGRIAWYNPEKQMGKPLLADHDNFTGKHAGVSVVTIFYVSNLRTISIPTPYTTTHQTSSGGKGT